MFHDGLVFQNGLLQRLVRLKQPQGALGRQNTVTADTVTAGADAVATIADTGRCRLLRVDHALHPFPEDAFQLPPAEEVTQSLAVLIQQVDVLAITRISVNSIDGTGWPESTRKNIQEFSRLFQSHNLPSVL